MRIFFSSRWKYDSVRHDVYMSWDHFADSLQSIISHQYDLLKTVFYSTEHCSEYPSLVSCASDLDQVLYKTWTMKHNAMSAMSSSLD